MNFLHIYWAVDMYEMAHFDMYCIFYVIRTNTQFRIVCTSPSTCVACDMRYVYFVDSKITFSQSHFHWKVSFNTDLSTSIVKWNFMNKKNRFLDTTCLRRSLEPQKTCENESEGDKSESIVINTWYYETHT